MTDVIVEKDSYIIVRVGAKCKLGFAHNPERNSCYIEETLQLDEPEVFEYDEKTLIACLGKKPAVGTVFGVHVEPHRSSTEHEIGPLHFYRRMKAAEKKALRFGLDGALKLFKSYGLDSIFPIWRIEVRNAKGKYAGMYKYKRKDGETTDSVVLHPVTFEDPKYNIYIMCHELAHALWYRRVPDDLRTRWLTMYNSYIQVSKAKKDQLEGMLKALVSSQVSVREFGRDCEEDDKVLFKEALTYLKRHHKLTPEDVNLLLYHNSQVLGEIWPTAASLSESDQPISAYAATNVHEFFAEAISYKLTGRQVPKKIDKLVERTFKVIRAG